MPWSVYILRCSDGSFYAGITNDLDRRIAAHQAGKASKYTSTRRPVELVWQEPSSDRGSALRRELQIKGMTRKEKAVLVCEMERESTRLPLGSSPVG